MRFYRNQKISESERLTFALLFSLVLHILLLFFVKFGQPAWSSLVNQTAPLNVVLQPAPAAIAKPSAMPEASRAGEATAKTGVQTDNRFPKNPITAAISLPVEQPRTEVPKVLISEEVMTINKPSKISVAPSAPALLVTETAPPEHPEAAYAPAPSVAKPEAQTAPPVEQLASLAAVPGDKQENIVFAEAALKQAEVEKAGSGTAVPQPAKPEEITRVEPPPPSKIEEPKPVEIKPPEPAKIEEPVKVEQAAPVKTAETKPVETPKPEPVKIPEPAPPSIEVPQPVKAEQEQPAPQQTAADKNIPSAIGKSDVFRAQPSASSLPSLAELSIASIRKLPTGAGPRIKFGQPRKKTIGLREHDFRYAMYADAVRLKLERIGKFNYPIEAARKNLSGTLSIVISVRADGSLEDFSIIEPSYDVLNAGAEKIVRMADPFPPLPENIRRETDVLSIKINWSFSVSQQNLD